MKTPESRKRRTRREHRKEWREHLIASRETLAPTEHAARSAALEAHLRGLLERLAPRVIGFCWPYRGEFDCRPVVARLIERGARGALPVIVAEAAPMTFREWTPGGPMTPGRFGIPIPAEGGTLAPDLVLMPVNAFDRQGYRLGYGGGYFDRTLAALAPRPLALGIGFELARVESILPDRYDIPMDYVVTEAGPYVRSGGRLSAWPGPAADADQVGGDFPRNNA